MTSDPLILNADAPIGEIVFNQPAKRNAISAAMWAALKEAVEKANADKTIKVVVLRGEGDHFAAGADISEFAEVYKTPESARDYTVSMLDALAALENSDKPTIAQIRGACVGGGSSVALACDFRFASPSAKFGVTPGKLGLVYSLADTRRLATAVGEKGARDLLLTARLIGAKEAHTIGLCDRLYGEDTLEKEVRAYADQITALSQSSIRMTKETLRLLKSGAEDNDPKAMELMLSSFQSDDFKEGYRAFLGKRKPEFPSD